jgi:prepilin-type N-terminal cleavage/methylation domain-containing protein
MVNRGFTLIEILIVVAIMGIIIAVAIPNYNSMMSKARIEAQTRELYSSIAAARLYAMQTKQPTRLYLGPNQTVFKAYTSVNDSIASAWKTVNTSGLQYAITKINTSTPLNVASDVIEFDVRGFTDNWMTLVVTPVAYGGGKNCIVVHIARTNIGRMDDASTCTIQ